MRIAIITCSVLPEPDPDQELLLEAIRARGHVAEMLAWDDPEADPAAFDLCVLRSCWDYPWAPDRFRDWLSETASRASVLNPVPVVEWNLHKGYLRDLQAAGVPVVPTAWLAARDGTDIRELAASREWREVVVKPSIGAGSFLTKRFCLRHSGDDAQAFLDAELCNRDMLVQKFMPSVEARGERALVWIDGRFTHQVVKKPRYHGEEETVSAALEPDPTDLGVAQNAMDCVDGDLLYARVDLIDGEDGQPLVSERELVEPSLFLLQHEPALRRLVDAMERHVA